jgi:hypothetical protein
MMDMAVDDVVAPVRSQVPVQRDGVRCGIPRRFNAMKPGAARHDFVIVGSEVGRVDHELVLNSGPVGVSEHVHEPRFDAASIHRADDV